MLLKKNYISEEMLKALSNRGKKLVQNFPNNITVSVSG